MAILGFWGYPPGTEPAGGLQTSNDSLALALSAHSPEGWSGAYILTRSNGWHVRKDAPSPSTLTVEPKLAALLSSMSKARLGALGYRLLLAADSFSSLDADLVFAPDVSTVFNAMDKRTRVIVASNDFMFRTFPQYFDRGQLVRRKWMYRRALDRADLVVVGSQHTLDDLSKYYPEARSKAVLWRFPAPVDLRAPSQAEKRTAARLLGAVSDLGATILYPAQFWPNKNQLTLIRALAVLRRDYSVKATVVLTGTGQMQDKAASLSRRQGVDDHVLFLGNVPRGVLFGLMADAAVVTVPSLHEQASYPLIEAGWFQRPILASAIPPLQGELEGHPDALVPPLDADAWAARLHRVLTDERFRERLVSASASVFALHSVQRQSEEFWRLALDLHARPRA